MNINTINPVILSINMSIISFIISIIYFSCFKPRCVQRIDVKGNIYIDTYLMLLYSIIVSLSTAIVIMIIKINVLQPNRKIPIPKQKIIQHKPPPQMKNSLSY